MSDGLSTADELAELTGMAEAQPRSSLVVTFSVEAQENEQKTTKAGRRIFEDVEIVEIRVPGDRDVIRHPATAQDREQYARQYLAFKRSQTQETANGTPLSVWPQMLRSQVEEARAVGIHTVEQLASISDVSLQRFGPGWTQLRQHARDWDKAATDGAVTAKLRNDLEAMTARVKTLESMLAKQAQELHRDPTATLPVATQYVTPADDKIAKLEAMVERLAAAQAGPVLAVAPVNGEVAPKRRGRPPGTKNKPKAEPAPQ